MSDDRKLILIKSKIQQHQRYVLLFCIAILMIISYWFFYARFIESTDNAYVRGNITPLSPKIDGYVKQIYYDDGSLVQKNAVLYKIDDTKYQENFNKAKASLAKAEFELAEIALQLKIQQLNIQKINRQLEGRQAEYQSKSSSFKRSKKLSIDKYISQETLDDSKTNFIKAESEFKAEEIELDLAQLKLNDTQFNYKINLSNVEKAKADLKLAELDLHDTVIKAPVTGVLGQRSTHIGEYVRAGTFLTYIVPLDKDNVWIVANFKETQVATMKIGQSVAITIDAFSSKNLKGTVLALSPASGSVFSLLPTDNSTGNFTKVIQRIPVKIQINDSEQLRIIPGMSAYVKVDTHS